MRTAFCGTVAVACAWQQSMGGASGPWRSSFWSPATREEQFMHKYLHTEKNNLENGSLEWLSFFFGFNYNVNMRTPAPTVFQSDAAVRLCNFYFLQGDEHHCRGNNCDGLAWKKRAGSSLGWKIWKSSSM